MGLYSPGPKLRITGRGQQGKGRNELNVVVFIKPGAGRRANRRRDE